MKKNSFILSLIACMFVGNAMAQHVSVDPINFAKSDNPTEATMVVKISSEKLPAAIDLNFSFPEGFDFARNKSGKITEKSCVEERGVVLMGDDEENEEHTFTFNEKNGVVNLVIADFGGGMFEKSEGILAIFNITCDENKEIGEYEGQLELLKMSDYDGPIAANETVAIKIIVSETSVGIRDINVDAENQPVYTVGGQRVASKNLRKGVYVVNGKKVTVK